MTITVIIPVLNEAKNIAGLVRYVHLNGGQAVQEVLVVDGGSTDDTVAEAQGAGARVIRCAVQSRAAQMNAGAREARGQVLYFVHADAVPPATFVSDIQETFEAGFKMGCYRYRFDSPRFLLKINAYFNRFDALSCQGGDKTFFLHREIFAEFGGYDEYYTIMEEYDFLRRALKRYRLRTIPKYAVVSARKYEQNGWLRVQLANIVVFNLFLLGAAPARMKRIYKKLIRNW